MDSRGKGNSVSGAKASKKEALERINQCLEWLRHGWTSGKIVQEGSRKWSITTRQVADYLATARADIEKKFEKEKKGLIADIVDKLDVIYEKAMFEGVSKREDGEILYYMADMNVAKGALMDKAKIAGLLKDQVEVVDPKAPDLSSIPRGILIAKLRRS